VTAIETGRAHLISGASASGQAYDMPQAGTVGN
jgi:hypothetical protein